MLSLAGGLTTTAALSKAQILRSVPGSPDHTQIPLNLKRIMGGKAPDITLQANDILFVPNSAVKTITYRGAEILGMAAAYGRIY